MKKIIFTIIALLSMGTVMAQDAQQGRPNRGMHQGFKPMTVEERSEKMAKDMELNEDQAAQVKALNEKYASMWERPNFGPRPDGQAPDSIKRPTKEMREAMMKEMTEKMTEMNKQREAYNEELKKIVGDEKFEKYQKDQRKQMRRMMNRGGMRGGFGGGMRGGFGGGFGGGMRQGGFGGGDGFDD